MTTNQLCSNLPQDVLKQILLLLPFESIPVCKLVSKEWKNLIDDPEFFKNCRDTSLSLFDFRNAVYCVLIRQGNIQISNTINSRRNPPFTVNRIPIDLKDDDGVNIFLSESSKGIVCVVTNLGNLVFYNLFTGASDTITDIPPYKDCRPRYDWMCYGFGYDCYDDDCKFMLAAFKYGKYSRGAIDTLWNEENSVFWVYSMRNRGWKSSTGFLYDVSKLYMSETRERQACAFNGVLHWVFPTRGRKDEENVIFTYDLHTCRSGKMEMPSACDNGNPRLRLVELGGQLCCWNRKSTLNVWAMKEYGVSKSWVKLLSIDNAKLTRTSFSDWREPTMIYECRDGRKVVLFVCRGFGSLYWYDIDKDKLKVVQVGEWKNSKRRAPKRKTRV